MSIQIIADSGCDITQEEAKKLGIHVLPIKTPLTKRNIWME